MTADIAISFIDSRRTARDSDTVSFNVTAPNTGSAGLIFCTSSRTARAIEPVST